MKDAIAGGNEFAFEEAIDRDLKANERIANDRCQDPEAHIAPSVAAQ
jgi:hypothetical protein